MQNFTDIFSDQNRRLEDFLKQNQDNLDNISNRLRGLQEGLMTFKNEIEDTLKQIERDISDNQSFLDKWISGANNKLKKEQISQHRINLIENLKQIDEDLSKTMDDIKQNLNDSSSTSQQLTLDFKNTENQLSNIMNAGQNPEIMPINAAQALQDTLQQVIDALNTAQQGIEQRNIYNQINNSIAEIMQ